MHTPAHVVLNLVALGRADRTRYLLPVLLGALIPDAPMFVFYVVERFVLDTPTPTLWRETYFEPGWQAFIDLFNSVPIILVGLFAAWRLRSRFAMLLCLSMLLHVALDLPLHHDDAHRHFYPFSNWRFESPVSYWDPRHFGRILSGVEAALALGCCWILFLRHRHAWPRIAVGSVAILQIVEFGFGYRFYL